MMPILNILSLAVYEYLPVRDRTMVYIRSHCNINLQCALNTFLASNYTTYRILQSQSISKYTSIN